MNRSAKPVSPLSPASDYEICAGAITDIDALCALEEICFSTDRLSRRSFRRFLERDGDDLLVIRQAGQLLGYALILYRRGTSIARLYSLALGPDMRGRGLGDALMRAVEQTAYDRMASVLRLEVRQDNKPAQRFYQRLGFRDFGQIADYYDDGETALRYQKWLTGAPPANLRKVPYYAQTTEFTCGPAAIIMAMAALDPDAIPDRKAELALWREATTIYMLRGLGGCGPLGLANAMARRGFRTAVYLSEPGPHFLDSVRSDKKRSVMALVQVDYAETAQSLDVDIHDHPISRTDLMAALDRGAVAVVLVSHYRLTGSGIPHWVMVYGHDNQRFYVHDPWVELKKQPEDIFHGAALPIPFDEYDRLTRYGRNQFRAALIVERTATGYQKA